LEKDEPAGWKEGLVLGESGGFTVPTGENWLPKYRNVRDVKAAAKVQDTERKLHMLAQALQSGPRSKDLCLACN
jgi:hypothetical protein